MCQFENQLLLCTCENNSGENPISWKLVRKADESPQNDYKVMGQINIPDELKNISEEEFDTEIDRMIEYGKLYQQKREALNHVVVKIENELNTRKCFDKNMDLLENDVLSILIDKDSDIWANFIFVQSRWNIQD